ncbi:MAG: ABC transporter ATP-binding protein [Deltaproteobacteria bacterium]|nr:ABC transporter ATP-binding protein [Deltaproteobacteria bacterium]
MLRELNLLRQLFERREKLHYVGLLGLMCGGTVLEVVTVGAFPAFVATLSNPARIMGREEVQRALVTLGLSAPPAPTFIAWACLGLFLLTVLKNAYAFAIGHLLQELTERHRVRIATRLFDAYLGAPYEFHLHRNSAETLRKLTSDATEIVSMVVNPLLRAVMDTLTLLAIVALLLWGSNRFALPAIGFLGITSFLILRRLRNRISQLGREIQQRSREGIKSINETFNLLPEIRILGREQAFSTHFATTFARVAYLGRLRRIITMASAPTLEVIAVAAVVGLVFASIQQARDSESILAELALFAVAVIRLKNCMTSIVNAYSNIQFHAVAVPSLVDDLVLLEKDRKRTVFEPVSQAEIPRLDHEIKVDRVTYQYPLAEAPSLNEVDAVIRAKESVAFVGSTGSGKTTLLHLLAGFIRPRTGRVLADDRDIATFEWRRSLGYVPQLITLVDDTLRRNIALGVPDDQVDEHALERAIGAAQLTQFVTSLPEGLATRVGERGVRISGGQRQRVGLARALYRDPQIMLMDEATSALDSETERMVMDSLMAEKNRTFIIVAHRLSTIVGCSRIYLMSKGRVAASGTYAELIASSEEFRSLVASLEKPSATQASSTSSESSAEVSVSDAREFL